MFVERDTEGTAIAVSQHPQILSVERACELLAQCRTVDEVKGIGDKAKAVALYLRTKNASIAAQNDAIEIRIRAERRIGELFGDFPPMRGPRKAQEKNKTARMNELGLKMTEANRCIQLAEIHPVKFDYYIEETRKAGELLTAELPLRFAKREREASKLKSKADPALVKAVELGRVKPWTAEQAVEINLPKWKQQDLANDPSRAESLVVRPWREANRRKEERAKKDPARVFSAFETAALQCLELATRLVELKAVKPSAQRNLQEAIAALVKQAGKAAR